MKSNTKAEAAPVSGQHTPGPWQYDGSMNGKDLIIARVFEDHTKTELAINGGRGYVCTIHTWETGYLIKGTEAEANAHLIASAPALLEALKKCKAAVENGNLPPSARMELVRDYATPTIAAAEGRVA